MLDFFITVSLLLLIFTVHILVCAVIHAFCRMFKSGMRTIPKNRNPLRLVLVTCLLILIPRLVLVLEYTGHGSPSGGGWNTFFELVVLYPECLVIPINNAPGIVLILAMETAGWGTIMYHVMLGRATLRAEILNKSPAKCSPSGKNDC